VVSSLFLLKNLPRATPGKKRFIPPLQFWIELLLFIALSSAAASFLLSETGRHIAIVIDSSLSMAAQDDSGISALERAKARALSDISQTLPPVRFTIFSSHSELKPNTESAVSTVSALTALPGVAQSFAADRLSGHLESLLNRGRYDAVWGYTDHTMQGDSVSSKIRVTTISRDRGETFNFWLAALSTKINQGQTFLEATTNLSSAVATRLTLSATCYGPAGVLSLPSVTFLQSPSSPAVTTLGPVTQPAWSHCNVTVMSPDQLPFDRLTLDNSGWITRGSAATEIELVSDLTAQQLGIAQLRNFSFTTSTAPQPSAAALYHRKLPPVSSEQKLGAPALIVFPPPGKLPWGGTAEEVSAGKPLEVSRWDTSHQLLKYVKPTLLQIPSAKIIRCPESSSPILFSAAGPLVCAGERNGNRYVIVGFELFPFDGKSNPTLSIFTLNLLSWLFIPAELTSLSKQPGTITLPTDTTSARYIAPTAAPLQISEAQTVEAQRPGVLAITRGQMQELFAINVFSEDESMLSRTRALTLPAERAGVTQETEVKPLDLSPWLALIALLIASADIIRRILRKQRWAS
jgi:hypothetical protein